jgi:hypothetical protein
MRQVGSKPNYCRTRKEEEVMPVSFRRPVRKNGASFRITASCGCGWKSISTHDNPVDVITAAINHAVDCRHTLDICGLVRKPAEVNGNAINQEA